MISINFSTFLNHQKTDNVDILYRRQHINLFQDDFNSIDIGSSNNNPLLSLIDVVSYGRISVQRGSNIKLIIFCFVKSG